MKQYEERAKELVAQMSLEEKAGLLSGQNFWQTKGVERLGIDPIMVTDGPHGLRKQSGSSDHLGLNESVKATCFPTAATTACSFDTELMQKMGKALGEECLQEEVAVILGPGANIKRSPLCGRNFEYFSEDPYVTGKMAAALIQGIQSQGIGTSLKHFAANNQEARRMVIDAKIDERALREIYLAGFEMAVKEAAPWTLMCSYNQINGAFSSQNPWLLEKVLREEWGYAGSVMTDWGAIVDRVKGVEAGLELEMPYAGPENDENIVEAVKTGRLKEEILDRAAIRITSLLLAAGAVKKESYRYDQISHHTLAQKVAAESAVLLKNEKVLPLVESDTIAVIGSFAKVPRYQGAGSSRINPHQLESICERLQERNLPYAYAAGYDGQNGETSEELLVEAEEIAKTAKTCVLCLGLPDVYESEGFDREHMSLPKGQIELLERIAKTNANVVVLLFAGSAIEMPWIASAKAVLMLYLGGEAGADAAIDLLYGRVNPSGKLAESFPLCMKDNSSYVYFPGDDNTVEYRESIYVGYRYYDKASKQVLFPFGHGLSYTQFSYSDMEVKQEGGQVIVKVTVKNIGKVAGAEVVQFYVGQKKSAIHKAIRELKGFVKVYLQAGEEQEVSVSLDQRAFAFYEVGRQDWCVEKGEYKIEAAASSRDIRCMCMVEIEGEMLSTISHPEYEELKTPLLISAEAFEGVYGKPLRSEEDTSEKGTYTLHSTLADIAQTEYGKALMEQMAGQIAGMGESGGMELMFQRMMQEMPVRALKMFSGGSMTLKMLSELLEEMNKEEK